MEILKKLAISLLQFTKKVGGNLNPEDFVTGGAADDLAEQIQNLISSLYSI
jgi:hypothetical protein